MRADRALRTRVVAVSVAALALAGCNAAARAGNRPGAGDAAGPASSPPVNVASPEPSGPPPGHITPPPSPISTVNPPDFHTPPPATNGPPGDVVLSGAVHAGAEPVCMLLTSDKIEYLLITPQLSDLAAGDTVTVIGHVVHGIVTHCMQGLPFQVDKILSKTGPVTSGP
jgi:hypothetical protein